MINVIEENQKIKNNEMQQVVKNNKLFVPQRKEYKGIDIMKILMAIVVVSIHTELYSGTNLLLKSIFGKWILFV